MRPVFTLFVNFFAHNLWTEFNMYIILDIMENVSAYTVKQKNKIYTGAVFVM